MNNKLEQIIGITKASKMIVDYLKTFYKDAEPYTELYDIIENGFNSKRLSSVKNTFKELHLWAKNDLPKDELLKLDQLLRMEYGDNLKDILDNKNNQLKKIILRGRITGIEEYAIVQERVEEIYQEESKKAEVEILNNLLVEYLKMQGI